MQFSRRGLMQASVATAAASLVARLGRAAEGAGPFTQAVPFAVTPIPLESVRLTGGPLKKAQELGKQNILRLEPDRMLLHFRELAGLTPKAERDYGSWEGPGRQLTGHMAGHYLSACSLMFAATGDEEFKKRAGYIVDELAAVQEKRGNGYVGALMGTPRLPPRANPALEAGGTPGVATQPGASRGAASAPATQAGGRRGGRGAPAAAPIDGLQCFAMLGKGTIQASAFDLNGMWSPWYVQHKIMAGLRDAYRRTGNKKALDVSLKFASWVDTLLSPLTDDQWQRMMQTEFGGINESFADLYADTGDKRWLTLSQKFHHKAICDPLAAKDDILGGKHGNTQVPKLLGELVRYIDAGSVGDGDAAKFFWESVVDHHSFATGGHGYDESFGPPDKLSDEIDGNNQRSKDLRTAESCNVYNMLKLTRLLFALEPAEKFAAFHERALFNHVLGSISFLDGQVCYMVPVSPGMSHEYQGALGMTCCCGTGLENHALHAEGLYYHSANDLYVNQFAASTAKSDALGVTLTMETEFPEAETATLTIRTGGTAKTFTLHVRRPQWAVGEFALSVNGAAVKDLPNEGGYVHIQREWADGDKVVLNLPMGLRMEALPDNKRRVAFMKGPVVLAADQGEGGRRGGRGGGQGGAPAAWPTIPAAEGAPAGELLKAGEKAGTYSAKTSGDALTFAPFYTLSGRRYGIYWDLAGNA